TTVAPGPRRGHARTEFVLSEIVEFIRGADHVAIEGLSYMSTSSSLDEIYGMHMQVRHHVWRRRIRYALRPPSNLSGYAAGDGHAGKLEMVRAMKRAFPGMLLTDDDNQADALGLATMGCRWKNQIVDAHVDRWPHLLD